MENKDQFFDAAGNLRGELAGATAAIGRILRIAHDVDEHKECGCERCAFCTSKVLDVLFEWQKESLKHPVAKKSWELDRLVTKIEDFASFPRSLLGIIRMYAEIVPDDEKAAKSFLTKMVLLCKFALTASDSEDGLLSFARIAHVLEKMESQVLEVLKPFSLDVSMQQEIRKVKDRAKEREANLRQDWAVFREARVDRQHSAGPHQDQTSTRAKRICGGGVARLAPGAGSGGARSIRILDFGVEHALFLLDHPLDERTYDGQYAPCPRELPFDVQVFPIRTERYGTTSHVHAVQDGDLQRAGKYFQVVRLNIVSPGYYYLALCKARMSNRNDSKTVGLIDRFAWLDKDRPETLLAKDLQTFGTATCK